MPQPTSRTARPALKRLAVALTMLLPGLATAQSLQELYEAARQYDATFLAAQASRASAEYRAAQADALRRPSAAVTAGGSLDRLDPPRFGADSSHTVQAQLSGRYALYNRSNAVTIEQAQRLLEIAQAELETAEQDLIVRLALAYFDVLAAQDNLATSRANKAAITEQLASARRNFEVGTATITDTREAQARFDLATAQELAAENDLLTRRIALDQLVGRSNVEPRPLDVPVTLPTPLPADADAWVNAADQQHPLVRQARVALEVARLETERARAADKPTVDAVASLGASDLRRSQLQPNGSTHRASVGVQLNWPLYSGGATTNRIRETLALEDKSRNDLEAARRAVAQGTRVAYFGVQSLAAQVRALEAAEASSKLALEATQLGYRVGVRVNLDVLNAQTQLFQTQRDLARARYDVLLSSLRLRQASGQLSEADVQAINRLLAR